MAYMIYSVCWLFEINRHYFIAVLAKTQRAHVYMTLCFSFPNPMRGTNLNWFTNALQYCVMVFKQITTEKDVKMTSKLGLWIILMVAFN